MQSLLQTMKNHGMGVLNGCAEGLSHLVVRAKGESPDQILDGLNQAKALARNAFLGKGNNVFLFFGTAVSRHGEIRTGWIGKLNGEHFIFPKVGPTHLITNRLNQYTAEARLMVNVGQRWVDANETAPLQRLTIDGFGFKTEGWDQIIQPSEVSDMKAIEPIEHWQIECPAMIFLYLPENGTTVYNCAKTICDLQVGVNSQMIVQATAAKQRSLDQ